jgi:NADH dehydrogenase
MKKEQILIVGGGFAGIELARNLKNDIKNGLCEVTLVSSHGYFEYYPGVYRIMIGESPIQTKIHLSDILPKNVKIIEDIINKIDPQNNKVIGVSGEYSYDKLVLALGSVPNYFNIQGLENGVFNFKSTGDAVILRNHLHKLLLGAKNEISKDEKVLMHNLHIIIGGAGPIGVELSGALSFYMKKMARKNKIHPSRVTIDLIDSGPRILPRVPEKGSLIVTNFLRQRGVNLFSNRPIQKIENETVILEDVTLTAKTIVWTGGVMPHPIYQTIPNIKTNRGRVVINEYLEAVDLSNVYIAGDGADTQNAGLAQTAIHDGQYLAKLFKAYLNGKKLPVYEQAQTGFVIPIGSNWALMIYKGIVWGGFFPGVIRYFIDMDYFLKRLDFKHFFRLYFKAFKYRRNRYIEL